MKIFRSSVWFGASLALLVACSSREDDSGTTPDAGGATLPPSQNPEACASADPRATPEEECAAHGFSCGDSSCKSANGAETIAFSCGACSPDKECLVNQCVVRQAGPPQGSESPSDVDDAGDLDAENGHPALDILASQSFLSAGQPWVRVRFVEAWPPPTSLASYQVKIDLLDGAQANKASFTLRFQAEDTVFSTTGIASDKTQFVAEAKGFRVLFGDASLAPASYAVESRVVKTSGGTEAQDTSGPHPFSQTEIAF